jgi:acyl transferase domain-containing protein
LLDGDRVYAVVRDTGLNQDGKTATITSPSADAQVKLIRECYKRARLDLADTGYVEAHMTGTPAGDPIEAEALARTFGGSRDADDAVIVGSVKTNLGHTEPVSGLAAVIKTAFALKHKMIPPNLNYETANPNIPLDAWRLRVPMALTPWPENKLLRASINNFGYGGTNAHAILEAAPAVEGGSGHDADSGRSYVFMLSAKDTVACRAMMDRLATQVVERKPPLGDLAYTLSQRRTVHPWMATVQATSIDQLAQRLQEPSLKPLLINTSKRRPLVGFVFNGQGAQWHAMGRELITAYPVFDRALREAGVILKGYGASWSLIGR